MKFCHAEFAYTRSHSTITTRSPFEVVYGINPFVPIVLLPFPRVDLVHMDSVADFGVLVWSVVVLPPVASH